MDLSNENVIHVKENGIEYLQFENCLNIKKNYHMHSQWV